MGDRGNIAFVDRGWAGEGKKTPVGYTFLYTHWGGSGIKEVLQATLLRRKRWHDGPYLCRLTFDQMLQDEPRTGPDVETGYGISAFMGDNEHDVLVVDPEKQKVYLFKEHDARTFATSKRAPVPDTAVETWTFEEFASHGAATEEVK